VREDKWLLSAFLVLAILAVAVLIRLESRRLTAKELALYATMAALAAAARLPFTALVSVQPTTFLVLLSGYVFGSFGGFMAGMGAAFLSNFFAGHGPWTPWQMLVWGLTGICGGWLGRRTRGSWQPLLFTLTCFAWGLLFGWLMNIWHFMIFVYPRTWETLLAVYAASLAFDLLHALGNIAFSVALGPSFYLIMRRFGRRLYTDLQSTV
jgi:energy-coupling factor transport system substrate-specific component